MASCPTVPLFLPPGSSTQLTTSAYRAVLISIKATVWAALILANLPYPKQNEVQRPF